MLQSKKKPSSFGSDGRRISSAGLAPPRPRLKYLPRSESGLFTSNSSSVNNNGGSSSCGGEVERRIIQPAAKLIVAKATEATGGTRPVSSVLKRTFRQPTRRSSNTNNNNEESLSRTSLLEDLRGMGQGIDLLYKQGGTPDQHTHISSSDDALPPTKKRTAFDAGFSDDDAPSMKTVNPLEEIPCCWLCLVEGPDDEGAPLVRDCSCRGLSGFAHLSCIINYAEHKGRQAQRSHDHYGDTKKAFEQCHNCKQNYQNHLRRDLIKARLAFAEKECKDYRVILLGALMGRLNVLNAGNAEDVTEGRKLCSRILSVLEDMKEGDEYTMRRRTYVQNAAPANNVIGAFHASIGSKESLNKANKYREIARDLYLEIGDSIGVMAMKRNISIVEAKLSGTEHRDSVEYLRARYDYGLDRYGDSDARTINAGVNLAIKLHKLHHVIEAERLLTTLVSISLRVHGPDHNSSRLAASYLRMVKKRYVYVRLDRGWKRYHYRIFQMLRYEGGNCVVQGPVTNPRNVLKERLLTVPWADVIPKLSPVICQGLEGGKAHLNGKIGDVIGILTCREDDPTGVCQVCQVHFEEGGLEPAIVKYNNLRIIFDLPNKKE